VSKTLRNTTGSSILVTDTGIVIASATTYTIPPTDYLIWAASSDVITQVGSGALVVNDGSSDLTISDGTDLIKGIFPRKILGGTDGTTIGNVGDRFKVDSLATITPVASTFGTVFKFFEVNPVSTKTETDGVSYTVPAGKTFVLTSFQGNYDTQTPVVLRLKKQALGSGAFVQQMRLPMRSHPNDPSHMNILIPYGQVIGVATDIFKITYESALSRGILWVCLTGIEY
jgi:hypothetical protein